MSRPALCAAALSIALPGAAYADVMQVGTGGAVAVVASDRGMPLAMGNDAGNGAEPAPDVPAAALTSIADPPVPAAFKDLLTAAAQSARVSPNLLAALVWQESRWRASALSAKGARGLTQLMPGTAHALAVDPASAAANLAGGARYLRAMLDMFDGDVERALAAYNAGPGRVLRSAGVPPIAETRAYVSAVIDRVGAGYATALEGENR